MAGRWDSPDRKCGGCNSYYTEVHYIGSPFDNMRYLKCNECGKETVCVIDIDDILPDSIADVPDIPMDRTSCVAETLVSYPVQSRNRLLKSSSLNIGSPLADPINSPMPRSSTSLDCAGSATSPSVEFTSLDLNHLTDMLGLQPCVCGAQLAPVTGLAHMFACAECNNVVGFDDQTSYLELAEFIERGNYEVEPCPWCGTTDPNLFALDLLQASDTNEEELVMQCLYCLLTGEGEENGDYVDHGNKSQDICKSSSGYPPGKRGSGEPLGGPRKVVSDGRNTRRTQINALHQLEKGDHISQHQLLAYWHHMIVVEVAGHMVNVIHYNGPVPNKADLPQLSPNDKLRSLMLNKGIIMDEWLEIDPTTCQLYRYDYGPDDCFTPDEVIRLARERLNEKEYNILTNNCEHFARACKTGNKRSLQVESFRETISRRVQDGLKIAARTLSSKVTEDVLKIGSKTTNLVFRNVGATSTNLGNAATKMAFDETRMMVGAGLKFAGAAVMVGLEVKAVYKDLEEALAQRDRGDITRDEFVKISIKRSCEGAGSLAGIAVALSLPAAWIGMPLVAMLGQWAGGVLGRQVGIAVVDKKYGRWIHARK